MRVLLPVDGSKHSVVAGGAIARLSSVDELVLLHVVDPTRVFHPITGFDVMAEYAAELMKELRGEGERILAAEAARLSGAARTVRKRLEIGFPAETILDVATQERVDLLVLGARGAGPLQELLLGSVSHAVAARAERPVLIVHEEMPPIRRLLVPVAHSADVAAARDFLAQRPFPELEEVRFLTCLPLLEPLWPLAPQTREAIVQRALESGHKLVEAAARDIGRLAYRARGEVTLGAAAPSILQAAAAWPADLVLMGARHRGMLARFFLGSVSHGVLHGAKVPVIVFNSPTSARADTESLAAVPAASIEMAW